MRRNPKTTANMAHDAGFELLEPRLLLSAHTGDPLGAAPLASPPASITLSLDETTIDEGGSVLLTATFDALTEHHQAVVEWGDTASVFLSVGAGETSFQISHQYLDDPPGTPDDYTIHVTMLPDSGGEATADTLVTVNNVPPVIDSISSSAPGVGGAGEGDEVTLSGAFGDVGTLDTHTASIDWGDGAVTDAVIVEAGGSGTYSGGHAYAAGGIYTITITLTDDDSGQDTAAAAAVISGVGIDDGVLRIIGTDGADKVHVNTTGDGQVKVHANFLPDGGKKRTLDFTDVTRIEVLLGDGNDRAFIAGNIAQTLVMDGGAGNDMLKGGAGPAVLTGSEGNDKIIGSKGNDILVGGTGVDRIVGGPGDDILIGGRTIFDPDDDALTEDFAAPLLSILDEWNSGGDFATRVANISGPVGGLNGTRFLDGTTVSGVQNGDKLTGASGENWYFDVTKKNGKSKGTAVYTDPPGAKPGNGGQGDTPAPDVTTDPLSPQGGGHGNGK